MEDFGDIPPHMPRPEDLDFERAKQRPNNATLWALLSDQMMINRQLHLALYHLWPGKQHEDVLEELKQKIVAAETRIAGLITSGRDEA